MVLFVDMLFGISLYYYNGNQKYFFLKLGSPNRFAKSTLTGARLEFDWSSIKSLVFSIISVNYNYSWLWGEQGFNNLIAAQISN